MNGENFNSTDPSDLPSTIVDDAGKPSRQEVVTYWGKISQLVDTSGERRFPTISQLTTSLLCLPHSNAEVERIFSHVTNIKTKSQNVMKTKILEALIVTKLCLPCSCVDFQPDSSLCHSVSLQMYDSESDSD